jgi:hypothetical protein
MEDDASGGEVGLYMRPRDKTAMAPSGKQCTKPYDGRPDPCPGGFPALCAWASGMRW